jgi:hypothetical protein
MLYVWSGLPPGAFLSVSDVEINDGITSPYTPVGTETDDATSPSGSSVNICSYVYPPENGVTFITTYNAFGSFSASGTITGVCDCNP